MNFSHKISKVIQISAVIGITAVLVLSSDFGTAQFGRLDTKHPDRMPEFTHPMQSAWLNSGPLTRDDLKGKVVLLDFWTFGCWNCYRSFPWMNDLEKRFADRKLQVIGVHTPEFDHERDADRVREKMREFELHHPVMIDNDSSYWRAMRNRYWPAFYVIDKKARIRGVFVGETHKGDRRARAIEKLITELLAES